MSCCHLITRLGGALTEAGSSRFVLGQTVSLVGRSSPLQGSTPDLWIGALDPKVVQLILKAEIDLSDLQDKEFVEHLARSHPLFLPPRPTLLVPGWRPDASGPVSLPLPATPLAQFPTTPESSANFPPREESSDPQPIAQAWHPARVPRVRQPRSTAHKKLALGSVAATFALAFLVPFHLDDDRARPPVSGDLPWTLQVPISPLVGQGASAARRSVSFDAPPHPLAAFMIAEAAPNAAPPPRPTIEATPETEPARIAELQRLPSVVSSAATAISLRADHPVVTRPSPSVAPTQPTRRVAKSNRSRVAWRREVVVRKAALELPDVLKPQ